MADPIKFKGIDRIVYGVGDMASGTRFFNDWGLKRGIPKSVRYVSNVRWH